MTYFGELKGIPEGTYLSGLPEAAKAGLIANAYRGISSGLDKHGVHGADAIILNGGYEFDFDDKDRIVYTGDGGNLPGDLKIVKDQTLDGRNRALVESYQLQLPVRVIRGSKLKSEFAPARGCRYDGLFQITDIVKNQTPEGYTIYQFILEKLHKVDISETTEHFPLRVPAYSNRLVRDTKIANDVKQLNKNTCQVCGLRLEISKGKYYSEGAHIQPLGKPFYGPDVMPNILCLCPNHHIQFDRHYFTINPISYELVGLEGKLKTVSGHAISEKYIRYHFERYKDYELINESIEQETK